MATVTLSEARGPEPAGEPAGREADPRITAFCSPDRPDPFHGIAYASQVWTPDPFDVDSIHRDARDVLRRMVGRVIEPSGLAVGRILLMLGEAGSGKTHLMCAFRNELHARGRGYVGYMQMTAYTDDYSRYVLANLIESLDKPYDEPSSPTSGLMRLSNTLAESTGAAPTSSTASARPRRDSRGSTTWSASWPTGSRSTRGSPRSITTWCRRSCISRRPTRG